MQHSEFYSRYERFITIAGDGCWNWNAAKDSQGYPRVTIARKNYFASHVALRMAGFERLPEAPCALHRCDNPRCVNPDHLRWGTLKENSQDMSAKGRAANQFGTLVTHCVHGHEYTPENTYWRVGKGRSRDCRSCIRSRAREYQQRKRENGVRWSQEEKAA
jgi:hypothetical protein